MLALNEDVKSEDYDHLKNLYRPSHADYTYDAKYGVRDWRGADALRRGRLSRASPQALLHKNI